MGYYFKIQIIVIDRDTKSVIGDQEIPFNAEGSTFEEARAKTLEYGQGVLRSYCKKGKDAFMRVTRDKI